VKNENSLCPEKTPNNLKESGEGDKSGAFAEEAG